MRFSEAPPQEGQPPLPEADRNLVMHVGFNVTPGNNAYVMLEPDTRPETDRLSVGLPHLILDHFSY